MGYSVQEEIQDARKLLQEATDAIERERKVAVVDGRERVVVPFALILAEKEARRRLEELESKIAT